ncbi:uncharacterized protein LOC106060226 [Biomphalaria glabrata]|uniref:Uncharacterized protein LOC106060226 n=1 Tax=Biomphalaria glabrata TaxID=6526 RepID=A0A9W2YZF0_BIOGL|nr:uncharacterized protein LOC106060226 [Biomphalaria glabrata]KAI8743731.1 hypothetical protein BgiBS90_034243 [Biomphalaria glabrata]
MAKPQHLDKLVLSIAATIVVVVAWGLVIAGSFVPKWARPLNSTNTTNRTYSLWGREDCYGIICTTKYRLENVETKRSYYDEFGKKHESIETRTEMNPVVTCVVANYCNITWFEDIDFAEVPSLLFVVRAFIIPSFAAGFICIIIYIIKIVLIVLHPTWRRIHVKAAYLTFAAVAGVSAGVGVIVFVTMLEEDVYELLWAPALPGVGGFLFICIAIGGYLSWRSHSTDEDFDTRSEFSDRTSAVYEFSASKNQGHKINGKVYHQSYSQHSGKTEYL